MSDGNPGTAFQPHEVSESDYRVVIFSEATDPETLEHALMCLPAMDRATAKLQSRLMPGIIPYSYTHGAATNAVATISQLGLKAQAISASAIPDLLHARQSHHVRVTDKSLEIIDTSDRLHSCAWDQIAVISVGVVPTTSPSRYRSASALSNGSSHRTWNEGIKVAGKHRPEAFLVLAGGQPGLLLASDEMNYESLGEKLTTASTANFKLLLEEIINNATQAWVTPLTTAFMHHLPTVRTEFRSHDEFRRYTEFQTLLGEQLK